MIVALYARVSTDDKGQDPYTQIEIIKNTARMRGYEIYGEYVDYASGKDANRPQWKEIMRLASEGRLDGIMALRIDRVMRSVVHLETTIENLMIYTRATKVEGKEVKGVSLIFNDFDFDPSNPNSKLVVQMLSAIAEWERNIISVRTREGMAHRKKEGVKFGKKARDDVPIRKIALMRLRGDSWNGISKTLGIPRTTILERREAIENEVKVCREGMVSPDTLTDREGTVDDTPFIYPPEGEQTDGKHPFTDNIEGE